MAKTKRKTKKTQDLDRRWSILLFGVGAFVLLLSFIPGESGWAWMRTNILFGAFGVSGWLIGPLIIFWAVLVSQGKPVLGWVIRGVLFLLALSGLALVFGRAEFAGLSFVGTLQALHANGAEVGFTGGLLGAVFGWTLLTAFGRIAARVFTVLILIVAVMFFTRVTPGDVFYFLSGLFGRARDYGRAHSEERRLRREREYDELDGEYDYDDYEDAPPPASKAPAFIKSARRSHTVDISLGPDAVHSEPGVPAAAGKAFAGKPEEVRIGPGGTFGMNPLGGAPMEDDLFGAEGAADDGPIEPFPISRPAAAQVVQPSMRENLIRPFDPFSEESLVDFDSEEGGNILLFGEHDPYAPLGGADSRIPRGTLTDVEYISPETPPAAPEFDLFGRSVAQQPVQFPYHAPSEQHFADKMQGAAGREPAPLPDAPAAGTAVVPPQAAASAERPAADVEDTPLCGGEGTPPSVDALIDRAAAPKASTAPGAAPEHEEPDGPLPYTYPPLSLFAATPPESTAGAREEMQKTAKLLVDTLASFGVSTNILDVCRGPSVTRYEIQPQAGVKISRITNLSDDIALNLAAAGVRIEAPIPGKPAVGIEVPNRRKSTVGIRSILESSAFTSQSSPLAIALGKDIAGENVVADLTKMPHLLIAGSTGSGKSVCINATIMSLLYRSSPEDVRMILIDPKVVELAEYNGIPHLMMPVVTEPKKAAQALGNAVNTMEQRYHLFAEYGVRDIASFNKLAARRVDMDKLPYIAIVIDELADLMMVAGKDVENYICRLAQKARAAGMHLIVATQRPSVDVITGLIKANIPSRIAFAVSSQVDSRTILDGGGAEKLLGMGDMLYMPIGASKPVRVQGTFVRDKEISEVLRYIKRTSDAHYDEGFIAEMQAIQLSGAAGADGDDAEADGDMLRDPTFISAVETALDAGQISTSYLQRRLRLGYARAGRIVDEMERLHIVSEPNGSKPREVLITRQQWLEMSMNSGE